MKKQLLAAGTGIATAGAVFAMAATLGGVSGNAIGADTVVVAACDTTGIVLDYVVDYDAGTGDYNEGAGESASADTDNSGMVFEVTTVVVSGIADACIDQNIDLSLSNITGKEVEAGQRVLSSGNLSVTAADANAIELTIDGDGATDATNLVDGINVGEVLHAAVVIQTA
jgi:hypothetical protein